MPELMKRMERKARKPHRCDYCGGTIEKGEVYEWAKFTDGGEIYEWKNHIKCGFVASELWEFIDPDDGMTEEDFDEGCREFCQRFICPDCEQYDKEYEECNKDESYCTDKMYDFLRTHEPYPERKSFYIIWRCKEREKEK